MGEEKSKRGAPKKDPRNVRTERISIVLTPNTLENLKTLMAIDNESMNNFVHELIDNEVEENKEKIKKYREFMKEMNE